MNILFRPYVALTICLALVGCSKPTAQPRSIESWEKLQDSLIPLLNDEVILTYEAIVSSEDVKHIASPENSALWWEMLRQWETPLVVSAGFECIAANTPDKKLNAAILAMSTRPKEVHLMGLLNIYDALNQPDPSEVPPGLLTELDRYSAVNLAGQAVSIVTMLPYESVRKWWISTERPPASASFEAIVVARLLQENSPDDDKEIYINRLKELGNAPGLARAYYLTYGNTEDAGFYDKLLGLLQDPENAWLAGEIMEARVAFSMCVVRNHAFIRTAIADGTLNLEGARKEAVERELTFMDDREKRRQEEAEGVPE